MRWHSIAQHSTGTAIQEPEPKGSEIRGKSHVRIIFMYSRRWTSIKIVRIPLRKGPKTLNVESRCKRRSEVFISAIKWKALQTRIRDVLVHYYFFIIKVYLCTTVRLTGNRCGLPCAPVMPGFLRGRGVIIATIRLYKVHILTLRALCGTRIAPAQGYWEIPLIRLTFLWDPKTVYHVGVPYIIY